MSLASSLALASASANPSALIQRARLSAVRALYSEVALEPKPGLVSFRDNGSHHDMDGSTFLRSLFALRRYFSEITRAGAEACSFTVLEELGINAEVRMLAATKGVNTHRGAIFCLGLLCASAGQLHMQGLNFSSQHLRAVLLATWGESLSERAKAAQQVFPVSNGQRVAQRYGIRSAREEAAQAFPTLFDVALPALQGALDVGALPRLARVQALFATMAVLDDTNIVHRGGIEALRFVQSCARSFLAAGGTARSDWLSHARAIHVSFVARKLSPGGAADMLASACWVDEMQRTCLSTKDDEYVVQNVKFPPLRQKFSLAT